MRSVPFTLVAIVMLAGCGGPAADPSVSKSVANDSAIVGTWKVVSIEAAGKPIPSDRVQALNLTYIFNGNTLTVQRVGKDDQTSSYTTEVDQPVKKITVQQTPPLRGTYAVNGETLQLCVMVDESQLGQHPLAVASSPATDLITLTRVGGSPVPSPSAPTVKVAPPTVTAPAGDADTRRTAWRYTNVPKIFPGQTVVNGVFRKKEGALWMEEERDSEGAQDYQEDERTSDYVELFRPNGGFRVRLYKDHADYRYAADTQWKPMFAGKWE